MVRVIVHGGGTDAKTPRGAGVERGGRKGKRRLSVGSVESRQTEATFFFVADGAAEERRSRFCGGSAATKKKVAGGQTAGGAAAATRLLSFLAECSEPAPLGVFASVPTPCALSLTSFFPSPCAFTLPPCLSPRALPRFNAHDLSAACRRCPLRCCPPPPISAAHLRRLPPPPISAAHLRRLPPPPTSAAHLPTPPLRFGRAQQGGTPQRSPSIRRPCPPPSLRHQPLSPSLRHRPPPTSVTLRASSARRNADAQPVKPPTVSARVLPFGYDKKSAPIHHGQGRLRLQ